MPALESHEHISRYGFTDLALVEARMSKTLSEYSIKVTLPDGTFTLLQVTNLCLNPFKLKALASTEGLTKLNFLLMSKM